LYIDKNENMKHFKLFENIMTGLVPLSFAVMVATKGRIWWWGGVMTALVIWYIIQKRINDKYKTK